MGVRYNPKIIVTDGLVFCVDAGATKSYPGTGTTWFDIGGGLGTNNATFVGGPTYTSADGGAILFDGVDDYVSSGYTTTSIANVTLQCWVKIESTSKKGAFIKVGAGGNGYSIGVGLNNMDANGNEILGLFPGVRWIDTNSTYGTGWKFVTMSISGSSVPSIYLGSTLVGSYSGTAPLTPTFSGGVGSFVGRNVGDEPSGARAFGGPISKVYIYNRQLSADEISQNFEAHRNLYGV